MKNAKIFCPTLIAVILNLMLCSLLAHSRRDAAYLCGIDGTCHIDSNLIARYDLLMGYTECGPTLDSVKKYNPDCLVFLYTSGTDNYTQPGITTGNYYGAVEHDWLRKRCIQLGYSPEILYLHFYDDTEISGYNIPGTYSASLTNGDSVSRTPDYLGYYQGDGIGRIMVNFAHPITRQLQIEYACMAFDSLQCSLWRNLNGRTNHFDGYYLDNWMHNWGRKGYGAMGNVTSGGRVAETPNSNLVYGTEEFADWYWAQMKLFATALRDTLALGADWTPDGRRKYLAYNTGQSWHPDYANPAIGGADYLNMEFLYNPIDNVNASAIFSITKAFEHDSMCADNGVVVVYCSKEKINDDGIEGEITYTQSIYDNLCWFYAARSDSTYIFMRPAYGAAYAGYSNPDWDILTWCGAMDYDIGNHIGGIYQFSTGTDPKGYIYNVYARQYQGALVLIRPRGSWGEDIDDPTKVTLTLPGSYRYLSPVGTLSAVLTSITLRNGEGAILIPASVGDCTSPPTVPSPYSPANGQQVVARPTLCVDNSDGGACQAALTYDFQISTISSMANIIAERTGITEGADLTCYTPSVDLAAGTYYWRARAYNGYLYSGWSAARSMVVGSSNSPPTVPVPRAPVNGQTVTTATPSLAFENSVDVDGDNITYQIQVSGSTAFSVIVAQASGVARQSGELTAWTVNAALNDKSYYWWRVRATDGKAYSAFCSPAHFYVNLGAVNHPPATPQPREPISGVAIDNTTPFLVVNNSSDVEGNPISYYFQLWDSTLSNMLISSPSVPQQSNSANTTSWQISSNLARGRPYNWRCRAYDGELYSSWSNWAGFRVTAATENHPPPIPQVYVPRNGDTLVGSSHNLVIFNVADVDGDALTYEFRVSTNSFMTHIVEQSTNVPPGPFLTTSYWTRSDLDDGQRYYWQARAYDNKDWSGWSTIYSFVHYDIAVSAQDVPQTLYPRPGETVSALRPQFVLLTDGDDLGVNFYFEVADNPEFNLALFSGPVVGQNEQTSWSPELNLLANTDYYWRARAEMSAWSEPIAFSVSGEIHVTPNPYRPAEHGVYITFRNLPPSAHLRILTVTGDLVKEFRNVPGPDLPWDVTNDRGEALASGVYLYYIEADGANAAGKFMVIR